MVDTNRAVKATREGTHTYFVLQYGFLESPPSFVMLWSASEHAASVILWELVDSEWSNAYRPGFASVTVALPYIDSAGPKRIMSHRMMGCKRDFRLVHA